MNERPTVAEVASSLIDERMDIVKLFLDKDNAMVKCILRAGMINNFMFKKYNTVHFVDVEAGTEVVRQALISELRKRKIYGLSN